MTKSRKSKERNRALGNTANSAKTPKPMGQNAKKDAALAEIPKSMSENAQTASAKPNLGENTHKDIDIVGVIHQKDHIDAVGMPPAPSGRASAGYISKNPASSEAAPPRPMSKVAFYVDGFNLYHGISECEKDYLKWVDLHALASRLIEPHEVIVKIVWCTAIPDNDPAKSRRHMIYKSALKSVGVLSAEGHFGNEKIRCKAPKHLCDKRIEFQKKSE